MEYMAANDDGVEDEVKRRPSNISNPEEDSRTATFSLKGSKRASPEPPSALDNDIGKQIDDMMPSAKRQKMAPTTENVEQETFMQPDRQEHTKQTGQEEKRRSHRVSNVSTLSGGSGSSNASGNASASMEGVEVSNSTLRPTPSGNGFGGENVQVRITNLGNKATLKDYEAFLAEFPHEPLKPIIGSKKKKAQRYLVVTFPSLTEAQNAIASLNGLKVKNKAACLNYESGPSAKVPVPITISSDEEGEIDESTTPEAAAPISTTVAETINHVKVPSKIIADAARQVAARMSKEPFKFDRIQAIFREGSALLLSVEWPTAAKTSVSREILRKKLYGIIPFARYDAVKTLYKPKQPKVGDPERCIVVFSTSEATTAAEQFLQSKQFVQKKVQFTIEVDRNPSTDVLGGIKTPSWTVSSKGHDRQCIALGIAEVARQEIAQGMYSGKKFLAFGSNVDAGLFGDDVRVKEKPGKHEPKEKPSKQIKDVVSTVLTRSMESNLGVDSNASENSLPTVTQHVEQNTHTEQSTLSMVQSRSLTDLPIPVRSVMSQLNEHERELQTRYNFITLDNELVFCPLCNERGHMSETCSERTCSYCGAVDDHLNQSCPKNMKCIKCRERGHSEMECTSALRRTAADGFNCEICGKDGHPEEKCPDHFVIMFKPPAEPNKVASLTVCCYVCASRQHYGDDCPNRMSMGHTRKPLTDSMHVFCAAFANKFLTTPLPPAIPYEYKPSTGSGRPPPRAGRGRGGRFASANGRDINNAIDLEMVQDELDSLPRRAPPRNDIPPPPRTRQPPLPPGPPPPSAGRRPPPAPQPRFDTRKQDYRGSDGYVQYQPPSQAGSYNNYPPPGSYSQPPRRRSRSPERRRGGGYMAPGRDFRDRNDGPQQQAMFPRGGNTGSRGPPGAPTMGRYGVHR